ncbi:MAG: hypothetical protein GXY72_01515 [Deltaproteobacteria bacterium]|nr:hypothetical protein [Deltaproteobacteria bacterium]
MNVPIDARAVVAKRHPDVMAGRQTVLIEKAGFVHFIPVELSADFHTDPDSVFMQQRQFESDLLQPPVRRVRTSPSTCKFPKTAYLCVKQKPSIASFALVW